MRWLGRPNRTEREKALWRSCKSNVAYLSPSLDVPNASGGFRRTATTQVAQRLFPLGPNSLLDLWRGCAFAGSSSETSPSSLPSTCSKSPAMLSTLYCSPAMETFDLLSKPHSAAAFMSPWFHRCERDRPWWLMNCDGRPIRSSNSIALRHRFAGLRTQAACGVATNSWGRHRSRTCFCVPLLKAGLFWRITIAAVRPRSALTPGLISSVSPIWTGCRAGSDHG